MSEPGADRRLILKRGDWLEPDRAAWDRLFVGGDVLDGAGPCHHWAEGGRKKREQTYGLWLGFCARRDVICPPHDVSARATSETVKAFIELERARCSPRTAYMHAEDMLFIFRSMAPQKDWKWLAKIVGRMRGGLEGGELKPRLGIEANDIFAWALKRMAGIYEVEGVTDLRRAALFRDGLMVGLLIATALRLRTFIGIDVEKHLIRGAEGFGLRFKPEDMKDKRAHEFVLPAKLTEPMRMYLAAFRPKLLGGKPSSRLWITHHGAAFTYSGFQRQLPQLTLREFGIELRPHAFRSIVATSIATEDPEHVSIIADVLQHSTLAMSHKHYIRASGVKAMSDLQEVVAELRRDGERRLRERRRTRDSGARLPNAPTDASLWGEAADGDEL